MTIIEKIIYLQDNHFTDWLKTFRAVETELSDKQPMWCICRKLATGLHERHCKRFRRKVESETIKRLKHLIVKTA